VAKITFTGDDGSVQEFTLTVPIVAAPTISEVKVEESDGTEVIETPAETPTQESAGQ